MLQIVIRLSSFLLGLACPAEVGWPGDLLAMFPYSHFPSYLFIPPNYAAVFLYNRVTDLVGMHKICSNIMEKEQKWGLYRECKGNPGIVADGLRFIIPISRPAN